MVASIIMLFIFSVLFILGTPVSISLGVSSLITLLSKMPLDTTIIALAQKMGTGVNNFTLLAIPAFVLAGVLMTKSGMALQLINLARMLSGNSPVALLNTNIIGNMLFGAVSGSAMAGAVAVGGVLKEEQEKEGYNPELACAVNIVSAPSGLLIPPSNSLIVYALASGGVSVGALFLAGYIPGLIMGLACLITAGILGRKDLPKNLSKAKNLSPSQKLSVLINSIPTIALIFLVIIGIIVGAFTATEGAVITVAYAFIVGVFFTKTLKTKDFIDIMTSTISTSAMVLFLIACSSVLSWVIAFYQIPQFVSKSLMGFVDNKYLLIFFIDILLLAVGLFMDLSPAVLVLTPILMPLVKVIGLSPIQFGIIMNYALAIGLYTPPVGSVMFTGCSIAKLPIEKVIPKLIPFYIPLFLGLLLISYIPDISLILPKIFGLIK